MVYLNSIFRGRVIRNRSRNDRYIVESNNCITSNECKQLHVSLNTHTYIYKLNHRNSKPSSTKRKIEISSTTTKTYDNGDEEQNRAHMISERCLKASTTEPPTSICILHPVIAAIPATSMFELRRRHICV